MKVHFIAIGGAVMHNLAIALKLKGYDVSGSDDEIFDPARANLERYGILPDQTGWFPERITPDLDAVILGMHARLGNPELEKATELGLKIYSFPAYIYEQSKNKKRVVIAGSHGKTTITSLVMHVLKYAGINFDYLVGAKTRGFDIMVRLSDAPVIVIEGDEYLTSPLDPRPKFLHYYPNIALISGIAWDHINVFPDFDQYVEQFATLVRLIDPDGTLIYSNEDELLKKVVQKEHTRQKLIPYDLPVYSIRNMVTYLLPDENKGEAIPLKLFGKHNLLNISGAQSICRELGVEDELFYAAIQTFRGADNRLQLLNEQESTTVYKDFAHAPSKLKATVEAVKNQHPDRRLVAVMELHTFSSLNKGFLQQYASTMDPAEVPVVYFNPHAIVLKKLPHITMEDVKEGFANDDMQVFTDASLLEAFLRKIDYTNTNLLMMSSGNFGGLNVSKLAKEIV
ncbi:MAG: UDP-N-acetylmuramate--L-alanine ligase [Bacteroidales bacterium]